MASTYKNGHKIKYNETDDKWYYADGQIADKFRKCPRCECLPDKNGHDACFNNLPGVQNACCGHGVEDAYIQFNDGTEIRFKITGMQRANNLFFIHNVISRLKI